MDEKKEIKEDELKEENLEVEELTENDVKEAEKFYKNEEDIKSDSAENVENTEIGDLSAKIDDIYEQLEEVARLIKRVEAVEDSIFKLIQFKQYVASEHGYSEYKQ